MTTKCIRLGKGHFDLVISITGLTPEILDRTRQPNGLFSCHIKHLLVRGMGIKSILTLSLVGTIR